MTESAVRDWTYWHPVRKQAKASAPQLAPIVAADADHPNGVVGQPDENGFVALLAAENLREQCLRSGFQSLVDLGNSLPKVWAFDPVLDDPAYSLSDQQKFLVSTNCSNALFYTANGYAYWMPAYANTPDPSGAKGWTQGPTVLGAGAFGPQVTVRDLPALLAAAWKRSALNL